MDGHENTASGRVLASFVAGLLWVLWQAIRWPLIALLALVEPIVRIALGVFAVLGTLTAFFWELVHPVGFPFCTVLALSLACIPALAGYHLLLRLLADE